MLTVMTTFTTTVCSPRTKPAQIVLIKYRKIYVFLHCSRISLQFFFLPVIDILNPELKRGNEESALPLVLQHLIMIGYISPSTVDGRDTHKRNRGK